MPVEFSSLKHLTDEGMGNVRKDMYMPLNRGKHNGAVSPGRNGQKDNPNTPADVTIDVVHLCGRI